MSCHLPYHYYHDSIVTVTVSGVRVILLPGRPMAMSLYYGLRAVCADSAWPCLPKGQAIGREALLRCRSCVGSPTPEVSSRRHYYCYHRLAGSNCRASSHRPYDYYRRNFWDSATSSVGGQAPRHRRPVAWDSTLWRTYCRLSGSLDDSTDALIGREPQPALSTSEKTLRFDPAKQKCPEIEIL